MISVIIPTYNEAGDLTATLDSVADSKTLPEVIVVDAGSADGTGDLARGRASVFSLAHGDSVHAR